MMARSGSAKALYKHLFVEELRKADLYDQMPYGVLKFDWVVNIKPVGDGGAVLKYLAPYVYRVAICDNRILSVDASGVTYKVNRSGQTRYETRRLSGESFVRCFAQHLLPRGFQKVRYYGFMSPNCKLQLAEVRWLIWVWLGWTLWLGSLLPEPKSHERPLPKCDRCGGELELQGITGADGHWIWQRLVPTRGPPKSGCE